MSEEKNVKIRLVEAWQDYLKKNNPEPTQVQISQFTAIDFLKLSAKELGSDLADRLSKGGYKVLNGLNFYGLSITIDAKRPEHIEPEFQFS